MDSIRSLVDVILAVTGQPKRVKVDARMCDQIRSLTLVDHKTAAEIAAILDVSEPTVAAARRRLGLTRRYAPKIKPVADPAVAADAEIRALEAKAEIRVEGPVLA